ncbi:MAG TPA: hypothetical protein V6C65_05750, partial [Allocoleopsis sp.]
YQQDHKCLGAPIDLLKQSVEKHTKQFDANEWIHNRPSICNKIVLVFADNIEVIVWRAQDWENDRRRS